MKIKPGMEAAYASYQKMNSGDPYSNRCVTYGEDWANLLEARIPEGASDNEVLSTLVLYAQKDANAADTDGITGFMYGAAVSGLSKYWLYGEQLRRWHNKDVQISDEGEVANDTGGVLNPAVLTIGS